MQHSVSILKLPNALQSIGIEEKLNEHFFGVYCFVSIGNTQNMVTSHYARKEV